MTSLATLRLTSPIGSISLLASARGLAGCAFGPHADDEVARIAHRRGANLSEGGAGAEHLGAAGKWLAAYFDGAVDQPRPALDPEGSPFARAVWEALCAIPAGQTRSYGELAALLGRPGGARAVGMANHGNPVGIIIPCHRVIGAAGQLTGYAAGLETKAWLLAHERRYAPVAAL